MKKIVIFFVIVGVITGVLYQLEYYPFDNSSGNLNGVSLEESEPIYLPLDPPFIVNFTHQGTLRYLQVSLEVMYYDQELINKVNSRMPAIRHALILLFSDQDYEKLSSSVGKETLRTEIQGSINELIDISSDVGEVYITNFVMQ